MGSVRSWSLQSLTLANPNRVWPPTCYRCPRTEAVGLNIKRIVAATDFSEASVVVVGTALNLALESNAILYLLHVLELPSGVDPMVGLVKPPLGDWNEDVMRALEELIL